MYELNIANSLSERLLARARQANLSVDELLEGWLDSEARLEKELRLFKMIADHTSDLIAVFSLDFRYLYVSASLEKIIGFPSSAIIGKTNREVGFEEIHVNQWEASFRAALQTGDEQVMEFDFPALDGQRSYQSHITPIRDDAGSIEHLLCVTTDITVHKREQSLRESEERYRIVSDLTFNYACSYRYQSDNDDEAQLEWVIGAFERITGHRIEDALAGFSLSIPVHPDDLSVFQQRQRKLHSGESDITDFRIFDKQNNLRWLRSYGRPEWDEEHQKVVRVYIGVQDITDQKLAEEKLAQERNLLNTLIQNLPLYVYVKDTLAHFILVNGLAARHLGQTSPEAVIGKTDSDFSPLELAQQYNAHDFRLLQTGQPLRNHEEAIFDHSTNSTRWVLTNKVALRDGQGQIIGLVGMGLDITERKQAEAKMAQLAAIVESSADAITSRTLDGTFISWNEGAERLYGYSAEEMLGQSVDILVPPDYSDDVPFITETVKQGERIENYETIRMRKDGKRIDISLTLSPLADEEGKIVAISAIGRDISERKQAERRFRVLLKSAPDAMVIVNADGKIVLVNSQTEKQFGYPRYELLGRPVEILIPEAQRHQHPAHRANYSHEPHRREMGNGMELYGLRKDGSQFPIETSLSPIETSEGILIASAIRDISERKNRQQEVYRLKVILDKMVEGVQVIGFDWRYVYLNDSAAQQGKSSSNQLVGRTMMEMYPGIEQSQLFEIMQRCMEQRVSATLENPFTFPDGITGWFELSIQPADEGIFILSKDISDRKRIMLEIEEARRAAEAANQLKSQFLATMSHELRTPLNAIIGFSDVMLHGILGELPEKQQEYIQGILDNGEHLLSLINDVLDVSKIEAGQFELSIAPVDLAAMLAHVQKRLSGLANTKELEFKVYLDPAMPPILDGDERRLKQIMINLIGNSIKFTEQGSIEARIEKVDDSWWNMSITDTGIGIPSNALTFLFEEFRQVDNSHQRRYEGTGLGLAIVQRLVKLMGGTITVKSELGSGSTFTVQLPLVVSE